jgi:hypothetical protein
VKLEEEEEKDGNTEEERLSENTVVGQRNEVRLS